VNLELLRRVNRLSGLITPRVGMELFRLAQDVSAGTSIVEIGSYRGKSTAFLAVGAPASVPIYAIDPWEMLDHREWCHYCNPGTFEQFRSQLESVGLLHRIVAVQNFSTAAAAEYAGPPVGLLFIDGNHSKDACMIDFLSWEPLLAPGAVVVFDDLDTKGNPGVRDAVDELAGYFQAPVMTRAGRLGIARTFGDFAESVTRSTE
jgi:predicted O-methyltransferase YrrM